MRKLLRTILIITGLCSPVPALSQQAPWERPRPEGMTEAHVRAAAEANALMGRVGDAFNGNPGEFHSKIWSWQRGRNAVTPISNMDAADLTRLLTGRYFIYNVDGGAAWNVWYMAPDGKTHFCIANRNGSSQEYVMDRYISRVAFGLAGTMHWDTARHGSGGPNLSEDYGWPMVGNARTGQLGDYFWSGNKWGRNLGWVQEEYAAAFAERCPNLPRVARVNNDQSGTTIQEIARGARPVRGFRTAFETDPADPLTVEMLYWAHPPR